MEDIERNEIVNVQYVFAPFWKRMMARFIDFLIFIFLAFGLFLSVREIVVNTDSYKATRNQMDTMMRLSCIYVEEDGVILDVNSYLSKQTTWDAPMKVRYIEKSIDGFIEYFGLEAGEDLKANLQNKYDTERLDGNKWNDGNGHPMFIEDGDKIIINIDKENDYPYVSYLTYLDKFYSPFVKEVCNGYFNQYVPAYKNDLKIMSKYVFLIELPIGIGLAGLIVFILPQFIFVRGRKTIGMLCNNIGRVDTNLLNVSTKRTIARSFIFYFGIVILSFFTIGAPLFVSFSMMAFTKGKQGFSEYLLGIYEVDTSKQKIYLTKDEAKIDQIQTNKEAINFKAKSRLDE